MQPADLAGFQTPSDPQLNPDGERVAFVVTRIDLDADVYERQIWLRDASGVRALTSGHSDTRPRWSPDGQHLVLLRAERKDPHLAQVAAIDESDQVTKLSEFTLGAKEAEWSPDGSMLAVAATEWAGEWAGLDESERDRRPARLTRATWQHDNEASRHDRRRHIYLLEKGGETRQLSAGRYDEGELAWHPAGDRVAFLSMRHEGSGIEPGLQAWEQRVDSAYAEPLTGVGAWDWIGYSPDGTPYLAGLADPWTSPRTPGYYRIEEGGLVEFGQELDRNPLPFSTKIAPPGAQWLDEGFVSVVEDGGGIRLVRFDQNGVVSDLLGGDRVMTGATASTDGKRIAFVATGPTDPGELYLWDGREERRVTDLNGSFRKDVPLVEPEHFTFVSHGLEIDGWVYLPPGDGSIPVLLNIHGGPASQYGYGFLDEFQVYAGAGYGVVACNPRGSSGRGTEFASSVVGEWQSHEPLDIADLRGCVDAALERFTSLDADRMGVMGGSYGGFATARLTAIDHRFRSAVVERALTAFHSFVGASDIGPWFAAMYLGAKVAEGDEELWRASPMAMARQTSTPTLVIHSTDDWRCPIDQGQQLFTMLQTQGVESEMLRFPGEGHELSRSGKPRHRLERFEAILDWHGRYLQGRQ